MACDAWRDDYSDWSGAAASAHRGPLNDSCDAACCLARELPLATFDIKDCVQYTEHEGAPNTGHTTRAARSSA